MVGKVIKNELILSIKEVGILISVLLILGTLLGLMIKSSSAIVGLFVFAYIIFIFISCIYIIIILYKTFYKSMFENEGYLTMTIPVKTSSLVFGKMLAAIILVVILELAIFSSICIFVLTGVDIGAIKSFFGLLNIFLEGPEVILSIISFMTSSLLSAILFFLASALFNTFKRRKNKFLMIVLIYFGLSIIINIFNSIRGGIIEDLDYITLTSIDIVVNIIFLALACYLTIYIVDKKVDIE